MKISKKLSALIITVVVVVISGITMCINSLASEESVINTGDMPKVCDLIPMIESSYCPRFTNGSVMLMSSNSEEWPFDTLYNIKSTSGITITTAISYIGDYNSEEKGILKNEFENAIIEFENSYNVDIEIEAVNSTVTNTYNCHAYAWYGAPANGLCWIRDPQNFFDDPHCDTISSSINADAVQIGDIVYFHSNTTGAVHSSIVDSITYVGGVKKVRLESKFGIYGVYTHSFEDTAYFYDYDYYTVYRYVQNEHDNEYTMFANNLYYHNAGCRDCGYAYHEAHSWELVSGVYRCSYCGITSTSVPGIMSLSDEEFEALLADLPEDEASALIAGLDPEARNRVTSILTPPDDNLVTE